MSTHATVSTLVEALGSISLAGNDNTAPASHVLKIASDRAHSTLEKTRKPRQMWDVWVSNGRMSACYSAEDSLDFARGQVYVSPDALEHARGKLLAGCVVRWSYGFSEVSITPPIPSEDVEEARERVVSAALDWENEAGSATRSALFRAVRDLRGAR